MKNNKNIDINELKNAAEKGNVDDFIDKNLSSGAAKKVKQVLSDKNMMEKMLSTPEAKALFKKFTEE
ncbi:MAG: hypothetical protein IKN26_03480 [Eubacterium sp.]|nr:hypothetical protein [Eubacterium sp.]MBR4241638.1 hypothetical protein [Eubacterium sp.]MBR7061007.1 hypothetical protein [Eubacterium sp.]